MADNLRRALVINLKHIGDVLTSTPVLAGLKEAGWQTWILVDKIALDVVTDSPVVDRVLVLDREVHGLNNLAHQWRLIRAIRRAGFEVVIDLSEGDRGAWLSYLSRARTRVGLGARKRRGRERLMTHVVPRQPLDQPAPHMVRRHLQTLAALGLEAVDSPMRVGWSQAEEDWADERLAELGLTPGQYVLVHPTSRWMFKAWTPHGNAALIKYFWQEHGLSTVMTAGPDLEENFFCREVMAYARDSGAPIHDLSGRLDLKRLTVLIAKARLFFGVDSAPMHLAAAVGTPVLVCFGPSGEHMWGPWLVEHEVVARPEACRPCGGAGCDDEGISCCLMELGPGAVMEAADRLLDRTGS
jgi:heptosyltransferase-3